MKQKEILLSTLDDHLLALLNLFGSRYRITLEITAEKRFFLVQASRVIEVMDDQDNGSPPAGTG